MQRKIIKIWIISLILIVIVFFLFFFYMNYKRISFKNITSNLNNAILESKKYTTDIDEEMQVYIINNKDKVSYEISNSIIEVTYEGLSSEYKKTQSAYDYLEIDNSIVFYIDEIRASQLTDYITGSIKRYMQVNLNNKYQLTTNNLEYYYNERYEIHHVYMNILNCIRAYESTKEILYLSSAKYYFENEFKGEYFNQFETNYVLNGYARFIAYKSLFKEENFLKSIDVAYEYQIKSYKTVIKEYESDFLPVYMYYYLEKFENKSILNMDLNLFYNFFNNFEIVKEKPSLSFDELKVRNYYAEKYNSNKEFVEETTNKINAENYIIVQLVVATHNIININKLVNLGSEYYGEIVQLINMNLLYKEINHIALKECSFILKDDRKTIWLYIDKKDINQEKFANNILYVNTENMQFDNIKIKLVGDIYVRG